VREPPERREPFYFVSGAAISFIFCLAEMRIKVACSCGVSVPEVRFVDAANGVLGTEWVNGRSVRFLLGSGEEADNNDVDPLVEIMVGTEIAKMHIADIVQGDLTTLEHDAPTSIFHQRFTRGERTRSDPG
jgi:hypothetical protein